MGLILSAGITRPQSVFAQNAKIDGLNQAVSLWLQNPDDIELGKTVTSQAKSLRAKMESPDEYDRHRTRGQMAFKDAKTPGDFRDAVTELESATQAAPWLAEGWYNPGMARKMAQDYLGAENDLKLYLLLSPKAKDAKKVKEAIYGIDYEADKAATKLRSLEGEWCPGDPKNPNVCNPQMAGHYVIAQSGGIYSVQLISANVNFPHYADGIYINAVEVSGNSIKFDIHNTNPGGMTCKIDCALTSDGRHLEGHETDYFSDGSLVGNSNDNFVRVK